MQVQAGSKLFGQLLLLLLLALLQNAANSDAACGYDACPTPQPNRYNVHLVAHTHDDVGWLRTVDQYYYYEVQFILDTVIEQLLLDKAKKFTYVEIAYFFRWWREQTPQMQKQVKQLVQNGQLQFALGGWCQDDEATTHYVDIIDQHTTGLRFLNDTFGECGRPRVAWQVDPFGHSKEHTALLAQMGFDAFYYGRIDYQDKQKRMKDKTMEMLWRGSSDIGSPTADLFSGTLYDGYCPPYGFSFDTGDLPIQDDPNLNDYNVEQRVKDFVNIINQRKQVYNSNHQMVTMGCDFQYQGARRAFKMYDKLIKAVNERSDKHNITVYYSTPSCYTKSVNAENLVWSVKTDDFFPYAHIPHGFWTGFYTSRAALKRYVRLSSNVYQVIKQVASASGLLRYFPVGVHLDPMRQAMGVLQHHDGVSGTEKQLVAYDYAQRLDRGTKTALTVLQRSWQNLTQDSAYLKLQLCQLANISSCPFTDKQDSFYLQFYNPVSHPVWHVARIPVQNQYYVVQNNLKQVVRSQTIPVSEATKRVPERAGAKSQYDLVFNVTNIPAMGLVIYRVAASAAGSPGASTFTPIVQVEEPNEMQMATEMEMLEERSLPSEWAREMGDTVAMEIDAALKDQAKKLGPAVSSDMAFYYGYPGNNTAPQFTASGAYLFRPTKEIPEQYSPQWRGQVNGPVVNEQHTMWSNWTYQVRRSYPNSADPLSYEENEMTVGPIPFNSSCGLEVIVRYNTSIASKGAFYTDANGRQMLKRVRDFRPTWKLEQTEKVAGNYYPINSAIYIADSSQQFVVLTDRTQGGGSIHDGQIEVMLHRATAKDDSLGVGEALQERGSDGKGLVVRSTHWLYQQAASAGSRKRRELASRRYREAIVGFLADSPKLLAWSSLRRPLPPNLQILSFEDWRGDSVKLLRMEHIYQKSEDPVLSQPVTLDLSNLFVTLSIESVTELTLAGNQELSSSHRFSWKSAGTADAGEASRQILGTVVTLGPMQIRTFAVQVKYLK